MTTRSTSTFGHVALIVAHCAGMVDLVALPVWVGTLIQYYKLDPQQAGGLATLFLIGGGDPVLGYDRVWKLLRRLRALGIERIAGDIVLDASVLRLPAHDPDAFDGRGLRPYNSGPHGLLLNYNTLLLGLYPGMLLALCAAVLP